MKSVKISLLSVTLLLCVIGTPRISFSDVIYDQGTSNWGGGIGLGSLVASDFEIAINATINSVMIDVVTAPNQTLWGSGLTWYILNSYGDEPWGLINRNPGSYGTASNLSPTLIFTDSNTGAQGWELTFDLGKNVLIQAVTRYYLALQYEGYYYWYNANEHFGYDTHYGGSLHDFGSWKTSPADLNFEIYGKVDYTASEPATMLLLASGLVGLAGLRRRFKK